VLQRFAGLPFRDFAAAIDAPVARGIAQWSYVIAAFVIAWFVYVPVHELMHAYGCMLAGGEVTRLEIAPEYGGALLARIFPFVVSGSAYAGQLTGFDVRGSDAIYLVTVLAPYLLTIAAGVPLLQRVARPMRQTAWLPWLFGASLPLAFAPFVSLTGDYYEAGSIIVSSIASALDPSLVPARWRSDDLFALVAALSAGGASALDWTIVAASFAAGVVLALLTYHGGAVFAALFKPGGARPASISEKSQ
jgi:hypothetical protein